ncbi:MAG: hypothetical protein JSV14_15130, partial [Deltaproteobacteria bacterium]
MKERCCPLIASRACSYRDSHKHLEKRFMVSTEAHLSLLGQKAQGTRHQAEGDFIEYGSQQ